MPLEKGKLHQFLASLQADFAKAESQFIEETTQVSHLASETKV